MLKSTVGPSVILLKNSATVYLSRFLGGDLLTGARERIVGRSEGPIFLRAIRKPRATSFSTQSLNSSRSYSLKHLADSNNMPAVM
jgi:hypothetical protein